MPQWSFPNKRCKYCGKFSSDSGAGCINVKIDFCKGDCQKLRNVTESKATEFSKDADIKTYLGAAVDSCGASMPVSSQQIRCSFCSNSGTLKKCLRCGEARYCGRDCQTKHWPIHKAECKRLAMALQKEPSAAAPETPLHGFTFDILPSMTPTLVLAACVNLGRYSKHAGVSIYSRIVVRLFLIEHLGPIFIE